MEAISLFNLIIIGIRKLFEPKKPTSKAGTIRFWIWQPSKSYYYDSSLQIKGQR